MNIKQNWFNGSPALKAPLKFTLGGHFLLVTLRKETINHTVEISPFQTVKT